MNDTLVNLEEVQKVFKTKAAAKKALAARNIAAARKRGHRIPNQKK